MIRVRTRATGLLARLAHDLELDATGASGWVSEDGEGWTSELVFPVAGLRVVGVLRGGKVDRSVLAPKDIAEIERKIRDEVLLGATVTVRGRGNRKLGRFEVLAPKGATSITVALMLGSSDGERRTVEARTRLSLSSLGCAEVKAPLGAFKVADELEVEGSLTFVN